MRRIFLIITFLMAALVACSFIGNLFSREPLQAPTETAISAVPTKSSVVATSEPATPTGGPISLVCIPPGEHGLLVFEDFSSLPEAGLVFLNSGGTAVELEEALNEAGVANQPTSVAVADFTGDGLNDLAISIFDPASEQMPPKGRLVIYLCEGGMYWIGFNQPTEEPLYGGPHLWYWQDLNGDNAAELVTSEATCGAHTCFEKARILAWDGSAFKDRLKGKNDDLPFPLIEVRDPDGDGVFSLEITGSGIGSVGAGPQRSLTRVWGFDPGEEGWLFAEEVLGGSNFRIHALHDAETAATKGDFDAAMVLYQRVMDDPSLDDWLDPEVERANLSAFAGYKMIVIHLIRGADNLAETTLNQLGKAFPPESPQSAYVEMASLFRTTHQEHGFEEACQQAMSYAENNPSVVTQPLGPAAFGYANPEFTPQDMCPAQ